MKRSERRRQKNKKRLQIIEVIILLVILSTVCIMNIKRGFITYNLGYFKQPKLTNTYTTEIQNPSFEADTFDNTKEITFNKNLTGWNTPSSDGIIGVKYNPQMIVNDTQYFFELNESERNSFYYNVQLEENKEYNWSIVHRSRTLNSSLGYCTAAVIIGPKQNVEPSHNSDNTQDHFMKITKWLKENDNMSINEIGISKEYIVYTSEFAENGDFVSETFSLTPTDECTEKWSVWLVKDSAFSFGEYNVKFNSGNISDAVVSISFFETTLASYSAGNLIKEFKIYNDNSTILKINAKEIFENNESILTDIYTKGYSTSLPAANSTNATVKDGIWNSTEPNKKIEIGIWNSTKNVYGLISLSNINASDGEQFVVGKDIYQTIATPIDNNVIKISFESRTAYTSSTKNRLYITDGTLIPTENSDTKKNQFDCINESSIMKSTLINNGLEVIYTPKFAENGEFVGNPQNVANLTNSNVYTEKIYVFTYDNSSSTDWINHEVQILNTSRQLGQNLTIYFTSNDYAGLTNLLDNVQVSNENIEFFEGEGTQQSPYLIKDENDFINFRKILMIEGAKFENTYFKQTNNITLTQPLSKGYFEFYGIYDGNGYYLENVNISDSKGTAAATLFHTLYGTIKNLGLKNIEYTNTSSSCGIADYFYGTIENCWITGNMTATKWNASIASGVFEKGQIKNTYFAGTLVGGTQFGAASYRAGSTPTFVNVFSTTDECITAYNAPNVTPNIINCETKTKEEMKTQEFLDTLNQYVNENNGLIKWEFAKDTGLPVLTKSVVEKPEIYELKVVANNDNNSSILWMYNNDTKEYDLYLPKSVDRNNLTVDVNYSMPQKEAIVYDENGTNLGILKSGKTNNYFVEDKVILKFEEENTKTYTINVMQSTLASVFLNVDGGDDALEQINADSNHDVGFPGTAVINDISDNSTTATFKKMKGRGNFTWTCSKKPYQVSFDEKISMLGMPKSKKWLFITNYIEGSLTRSAIFYKFTQELGIQYAITFETADLYINGKYNGTYLVTSKVEQGTNRVEITDDDYLMEIDNYTDTIQFTTEKTNKKITIKSPDVEEATLEEQQAVINGAKTYLDSIEDLIYDPDVTFEELSKKIDMESFAKCYWVYEISMNYDAMYGSSYMYTKNGLLYMGPMWDFDNTLNLLSKNATPLDSYYLLGKTGGAAAKRLRWYNELMKHQEFSDLVDKVYLENVDKFDKLVEFTKQYNENITASAKMNYTRWPYDKMKQEHNYYMGGNSFEEASQNLILDIEKRVNFYKNEYKDLIIKKVKFETTDVNGQIITKTIDFNNTDKIEIPNTVAIDAEVKLTGISENNVERDMGTVNLTDGKYKNDIAISNKINVELDKKSNRNIYSIELQRADLEIKSINITQEPIKTVYFEGYELDTTGLIVTATYSDNTTSEISDYEIDLKGALKVSDTNVVITYQGKTDQFGITVKENTLENLEVTTLPTKTKYVEGQNFDATGMVITATYLDGTKKTIKDYTIENGEGLTEDMTEVEVKYGTLSTYVPIVVNQNVLVSIEISKQPIKIEYIEGQEFDSTGMVVTGTMLDGNTIEVFGYTVTENKLSINDTKVEVQFKDKVAYVDIVVKKNKITKLEIIKQPTKIEYIEGQKFDSTGMKVKATYLDGTEKEITNYTISKVEALNVEDKKIEVEFEGLKTTLEIKVSRNTAKKLEIIKQPNKTQYEVGEKFDSTGMKVKVTYLDGTEKEITNYTISKVDSLNPEDKNIKIEYDGLTANIDITVTEKFYKVLEGVVRDFTKNQDKSTSVRIDAEITLFQNVYMDGKEIDKSNYVITSGSTIITLKQSYLNTLDIGNHTMKTVFSDNGVAYSTINILEDESIKEEFIKEPTNDKNNTLIQNPITGDNIIIYIVLFVISITAFILIIKFNTNHKPRKH